MEPIKNSLAKWMRENKNFQENYNKISNAVLNDPEIKEFLSLHPELTKQEINKNLIKLYEYKTQSKQCENCTCLEEDPRSRRRA